MLQASNIWVEAVKNCVPSLIRHRKLAICAFAHLSGTACVCQLGSYLLKLQPFSTLVCRMGESRVQGLQCCCGKISMRPQDKQKWPPWFNTSVDDGRSKADLIHGWGSWKKWCVQPAGTRRPVLHNLVVRVRIFKFQKNLLHNWLHGRGSTKYLSTYLKTRTQILNTDTSCLQVNVVKQSKMVGLATLIACKTCRRSQKRVGKHGSRELK